MDHRLRMTSRSLMVASVLIIWGILTAGRNDPARAAEDGASYVPDVFVADENPPSPTFGVYPPNVIRRFDRSTGKLISTVTIGLKGLRVAPGSHAKEAVIDGSFGANLDLVLDPGVKPAAAQATVTIDLHETFRIGKIQQVWGQGRHPLTYSIQGSTDGKKFTNLVDSAKAAAEKWDGFGPADVRQIRLIAKGVDGNELNLMEVRAFLDGGGPPPTTGDGLDVTYLQGIVNVIDETPKQWDGFVASPKPTTSFYFTGKPEATADASGVLDLGKVHRVIGLNAIFDNYLKNVPDAWQNGGAIQVRGGVDQPWSSVFDGSKPMSTVSLNWASAPKMVRQVRFVNKFGTYPAGGPLAGKSGTGTGRLSHIEVATASDGTIAPTPIKTVTIPADGSFSAAVYDEQGTLVRTLYRGRPVRSGTRDLYWDGADDDGRPAPTGREYLLRTLFGKVRSPVVTAVGNSGTPGDPIPPLDDNSNSASGSVVALAVDPAGDLYTGSPFEENATELRKLTADGKHVWEKNAQDVFALASDGDYLFASQSGGGACKVFRLRARDGAYAGYDGKFRPNDPGPSVFTPIANNPDPRPKGVDAFTSPGLYRDLRAVMGIAVEVRGNGLFLTNHPSNRVEVWNKSTGKQFNTSALAVPRPFGIAVEPGGGAVWVAYNGDRVSRFRYDRSTYEVNPTPVATIEGLKDPCGVALANLGGKTKNLHLFVTERGRNKIREYDVNSDVPANVGRFADFGRPYSPGRLEDDEFAWGMNHSMPALAVADGGVVTVADSFNRRVQRFKPDGSLYQSMFKEYVPSPWVDTATISKGAHSLLSGGFEFQVKPSGGVFADGLGDKSWRLVSNWTPADGKFFTSTFFSPTKRLTLDVNKGSGRRPLPRTFLFNLHAGRTEGIVVYAVEGESVRRSAIVADFWTGPDDSLAVDQSHGWTWVDKNGDGKVDFVSPTDARDEVEWFKGAPWAHGQEGTIDVDDHGNLWVSNGNYLGRQKSGNAIYKIPLAGFEKVAGKDEYNPIYRIADARLFAASDSMLDPNKVRQVAFIAKPTADGGLLAATRSISPPFFWTIRTFDAAGRQRRAYPTMMRSAANMIAADPDPKSGYFYDVNSGGSMHWIYMRDADGLVVAVIMGEDSPWGSNWVDSNAGVWVFLQDGTRYVYAEDVFLGKSNLYRIDGLDTLKRDHYKFTLGSNPRAPSNPTSRPNRSKRQTPPAGAASTR